MNYKISNKQIIYKGFNTYKKIGKIVNKLNVKNILLITTKNSYITSGAKDAIEPQIKKYNIIKYNNFENNPKLKDILYGVNLAKKNNCDLIISIGGGSCIDVAKSISILAAQEKINKTNVIETAKFFTKNIPLIAIPTTTGTGSESTKFSVIYINKKKYSLENNYMLPKYVILDPTFSLNLPKKLIAITGIDALSQAIESFWSINSTKESRKYSLEALSKILKNIELAVNKPTKRNIAQMLYGANLSGKAINISKTTAPHAISYPFTTHFNIPHGHAVGLTLPNFIILNSKITENNINDPRGVEFVEQIIKTIFKKLNVKTATQAKNKLLKIFKNIGIETKLQNLNITNKDFDKILSEINADRLKNNPRKISKTDVKKVLYDIL